MCHHAMQFSPDLEAPTCRIRDLATQWIAELLASAAARTRVLTSNHLRSPLGRSLSSSFSRSPLRHSSLNPALPHPSIPRYLSHTRMSYEEPPEIQRSPSYDGGSIPANRTAVTYTTPLRRTAAAAAVGATAPSYDDIDSVGLDCSYDDEEDGAAYACNKGPTSLYYDPKDTASIDSNSYDDDDDLDEPSSSDIQSTTLPTTTPMTTQGRCWNEEYQRILLMPDGPSKYEMLQDLAFCFVSTAQLYGRIIIEEQAMSIDQKTIKPVALGGIAGGDKYLCHSILFKFARDSQLGTKWMYGGSRGCNTSLAIKVYALVRQRFFSYLMQRNVE